MIQIPQKEINSMNLLNKLLKKLWTKKVLALIFIINILGTIFGYYYYQWQLANSELFLWIFIPDCPNATLLLLISILITFTDIGEGIDNRVFNSITAAYLIKYGVWTVFTILFFSEFFLSPPNLQYYAILLIGHAGMALESILILPFSKIEFRKMVVFLLWFLINDFVDYWLGAHPYVPDNPYKIKILAIFTISMSFITVALVYLYPRYGKSYESFKQN